MSQQLSRLADDDPDRYETKSEQVSREISSEDVYQEYEIPKVDTLTGTQSLPATDNQASSDGDGFTKWQTIIWREWSRCEDDSYAFYLFDLIKNTTFGWKFIVTMAVLGTVIGALMGYAIGFIMASGGLYLGPLNLTAFPALLNLDKCTRA